MVLALGLLTRLPPRILCPLLVALARPRRGAPDEAAAARVQRAVAAAERLRPQTCLTRTAARFVLLRRAGYPVELVFGIGPHEGAYAGHCWLELDGAPYLERVDPRPVFPQILRVPAAT
jgi:hypothetical protein